MSVAYWPWKAPSAPAIVRSVGFSHEHEREQELVPRPDGEEDRERRDGGSRERHVDAPEEVERGRAVDAGGLRELLGHAQEVGAHPEDAEGHVEPDERQDDGQLRVVEAELADDEVERDDDARERQREPEQEEEEERPRPGMRRCPMAKPAMVAKTTETGTTPSTMSTLEVRRAPMCAWSKASRKLPHCGSAGQAMPEGHRPATGGAPS